MREAVEIKMKDKRLEQGHHTWEDKKGISHPVGSDAELGGNRGENAWEKKRGGLKNG